VANYGVDIEVALKGTEKLRQFEKLITRSADQLERLEEALKNVKRQNPYDVTGARRITELDKKRTEFIKEQNRLLSEQESIQRAIKSDAARASMSEKVQGKKEMQEALRSLEQRKKLEDMMNRGPSNEDLDDRARRLQDLIDRTAQAEFDSRKTITQLEDRLNEITAEKKAKLSQLEHQKELDNIEKEARLEKDLSSQQHQRELRQFDERLRRSQQQKQQAQLQRTRLQEDLILGAGFPLLFGGGPGAVLGGAAGALAAGGAGGFAFQIGLSAIGQQFDIATESSREFVRALRENGDAAGYLESTLGTLDPAVKKTISNLQQAGQTAKAAQLTKAQLAQVVGTDGVTALERFGLASEKANRKLKELGLQAFVQLAKLSNLFGNLFFGAGPRTGPGEDVTNAVKDAAQARQRSIGLLKLEAELAGVNRDLEFDRAQALEKQIAARERDDEIARSRQLLDVDQDLGRYQDERRQAELTYQQKIAALDVQRQNRQRKLTNEAATSNLRVQQAQITFEQNRVNLQSQVLQLGKTDLERLNIQEEEQRRLYKLEQNALQLKLQQNLVDVKEQDIRNDLVDIYNIELKQLKDKFDAQKLITAEQKRQLELQNQQKAITSQGAIQSQRGQMGLQLQSLRGAMDPAFMGPFGGASLTEQTLAKQLELDLQEQNRLIRIKEIDVARGVATENEVNDLVRLRDEYELFQTEINAATVQQERFNEALGFTRPAVDSVFSSLMSVAEGTKTAQEAFADFLRTIANMLVDVAAQMIATYIAIGIARSFAGMGGGGGETNAQFMERTGKLDMGIGDLYKRANGGAVSSGTPYLVGERGPELFVPGAQGNIVPNNAMSGANIVVNVDAKGTQAQGNQPNSAALGRAIGAAVQAELIKQKRPGGLLA
jgi:hypothetical protein